MAKPIVSDELWAVILGGGACGAIITAVVTAIRNSLNRTAPPVRPSAFYLSRGDRNDGATAAVSDLVGLQSHRAAGAFRELRSCSKRPHAAQESLLMAQV